MSPTGTPFLCTVIALSVVALVVPLLLWSRLPGPRLLRAAARTLMLVFAQATAVALVFTPVNNANNLYDDRADLLGTGNHVQRAADLGPDGTGGIAVERLPPQYDDPAYRHRTFPVVELLPGYPGSPKSWFGALGVHEQLLPLMREGGVAPFTLVAPRTTLLPGVDTGRANVPGTVNADSWLSPDVPKTVRDNFRAEPAPRARAVAGCSAGAHCAAKPAVSHPDRYRAAVSLSGYNDPIGERDSLTARNPALRRANDPCLLLRGALSPPPVALYASGQPHDGYEAALALRRAAKAPTDVHVVYVPRSAGGHHMALWRPQVVPAFRWLTTRFDRRGPAGGATPPAPSSDGSTHAGPASGTAWRAAAGRRP